MKHRLFNTALVIYGAWVCLSPIMVRGAVHGNYSYFVTAGSYAPHADWSQAVKLEFGPNAEVVDWNTLKSDFGSSVSDIRGLFDELGILAYPLGDAPAVTWNGNQIWSGDRSYGVNRLEGTVPGGYLVHDQIQNYWVCLGSWPADRRIIARIPAGQPKPRLDIRVSQVEICWQTATNEWYQLQYRSALTTNQWLPLSTNWVTGDGARFCTTDAIVVGSPQRFYQLSVTNSPPQ